MHRPSSPYSLRTGPLRTCRSRRKPEASNAENERQRCAQPGYEVGTAPYRAANFAREILIPVTLAILLSFLVAPLANLLGRIKLGHVASVLIAVTMSVSVIVVLGGMIATQITDLAVDIPRYQESIDKKISVVHGLAVGKLNRLAGAAGEALQRARTKQRAQPFAMILLRFYSVLIVRPPGGQHA